MPIWNLHTGSHTLRAIKPRSEELSALSRAGPTVIAMLGMTRMDSARVRNQDTLSLCRYGDRGNCRLLPSVGSLRPTVWDLVGATISIVGMGIIMFAPRLTIRPTRSLAKPRANPTCCGRAPVGVNVRFLVLVGHGMMYCHTTEMQHE